MKNVLDEMNERARKGSVEHDEAAKLHKKLKGKRVQAPLRIPEKSIYKVSNFRKIKKI